MWIFIPRWLPDRSHKMAFGNLREFTLEVTVAIIRTFSGKTLVQAGLRQ